MKIDKKHTIALVLIGTLLLGATGVIAQNSTIPEEEPNDGINNATLVEVGQTITANISGNDTDVYRIDIGDESARGILSLSPNATGQITYTSLVGGPATSVPPGEASEVFNTSQYPYDDPEFGNGTFEVISFAPSAAEYPDPENRTEGQYTFTIEAIDENESATTEEPSTTTTTTEETTTTDAETDTDTTTETETDTETTTEGMTTTTEVDTTTEDTTTESGETEEESGDGKAKSDDTTTTESDGGGKAKQPTDGDDGAADGGNGKSKQG